MRSKSRKILDLLLVIVNLSLTAWLFFDFAKSSLLLLLYLPVSVYCKRMEWEEKKKWEITLAFKDALVSLENSLTAGHSPENSFRETAKNMEELYGKDHRLCREFYKMVIQMDLN